MSNKSKSRQNWYDSNPFFFNKEGYENFITGMKAAAEEGHLPVCLKHEEPECLTMDDIKQFSQQFMQDTGLQIEFHLFTCKDCGRLHCHMVIDEYGE